MNRLETARVIADVPFILSSAARSVSYEISKGRKGTSSHCLLPCVAVDILCSTGYQRQRIIYGLISAGFTRIGIAKTFIHVDYDTDKTDAIWLY